MAGVSLTRSNRTRRADDRAPGGRRCSQFRSVPLQVEFRQRLWAPLFVSVFFDAGSAAPRIGDLKACAFDHDRFRSVLLFGRRSTIRWFLI